MTKSTTRKKGLWPQGKPWIHEDSNYWSKPYGNRQAFQFYRKNLKEDISVKTIDGWAKICKLVNDKCMGKLIEEVRVFKMPAGLGEIEIEKNYQPNPKKILNWPETRKQGKYVYHLNKHSDGFIMSFYWNRKRMEKIKNGRYYAIMITRTNKDRLRLAIHNIPGWDCHEVISYKSLITKN